MKPGRLTIWLLLLLVVCVTTVFAVEAYWMESVPYSRASEMSSAVQQAEVWFEQIGDLKSARGIGGVAAISAPYAQMIGDDFSILTTTLGSLKAKTTAANPEFAAVIFRWLVEAGIDSSSVVGMTMSASFPSLAIASLAALQKMNCRVVIISSLGASTFGANQPECTWLDMEQWLRRNGGLRYASQLVTYGAEGDRGEGLTDEGLLAMDAAALRNDYDLYVPASLEESIERKVALLKESSVDLLINIGGNQTCLGACVHGPTIPNGYNDQYQGCTHPDRGIISRLAQQSVPYVHLLNIRDLAIRYGLDLEAGALGPSSDHLYSTQEVKSTPVIAGLVLIWGLVFLTQRVTRNPATPGTREHS